MTDQWEDMGPADRPDELRIRRVDTQHPLDFYYGKDSTGRYVFIYKGRITGSEIPVLPKLAGIGISLTSIEPGCINLQLQLPDSGQADIFKALCTNLMSATRSLDAKSGSEGIGIILARLYRWHELLKTGREKLLSQSQITGLCGELMVLRDLFLPRIAPFDAITAWRGPYGDEQDFLYKSKMIEVKTQLNSSDRKLQISSVDQLDTVSGEIFVCHQTLGGGEEGGQGCFSLNTLVDELLEILKKMSPAAADVLYAALIEYGYARRSEYDERYYILSTRNYFKVTEEFPALRASSVPVGVTDVRYSILLEACRPFEVEEKIVIQSLFV